MLRNDGNYVIYILQHRDIGDEEWHDSGDGEQFCGGAGDFRENPRRAFNACGKCWQKTGVHGTFDLDHATALLTMVAKNSTGQKFRIALVEISQKTTEIMTMCLS